mmetsp:Transcript_5722/g.23660  ORF Transcript_5722/g.23660 Transcript_5722/m.23660 type:complete len:247 (-) Transcript_5722:50-790(-)
MASKNSPTPPCLCPLDGSFGSTLSPRSMARAAGSTSSRLTYSSTRGMASSDARLTMSCSSPPCPACLLRSRARLSCRSSRSRSCRSRDEEDEEDDEDEDEDQDEDPSPWWPAWRSSSERIRYPAWRSSEASARRDDRRRCMRSPSKSVRTSPRSSGSNPCESVVSPMPNSDGATKSTNTMHPNITICFLPNSLPGLRAGNPALGDPAIAWYDGHEAVLSREMSPRKRKACPTSVPPRCRGGATNGR